MVAKSYVGETVIADCVKCGESCEVTVPSFDDGPGFCPNCEKLVYWDYPESFNTDTDE